MLLPLTAGFLFGLLLGSFIPYVPLLIVFVLMAAGGLLTYLEQRGRLARRHGLLAYGSILAGILYWTLFLWMTSYGTVAHVAKSDSIAYQGTICEPVRHGPNRAVIVL